MSSPAAKVDRNGRPPLYLLSKSLRAAIFLLLVANAATGCVSNASRPVTEAPQPALARFQYTQVHMGVPVRLTVYAPDEQTASTACRAAYERMAQLDDILSDYRSQSELMRLSAKAGGGPVPVSNELYTVLAYARAVSSASDGTFDVTVGPAVQLWRRARKTHQMPTDAELAEARGKMGYRKVVLDPDARTVTLVTPGMRLDLGGIAKGYAGDEVIGVLKAHGIRRALFEAGGDIVASDAPPDKRGWTIELFDSDPDHPRRVDIANSAISTSGDTEQFVILNGRRYSHVVDPRTAIGLTNHHLATVTAKKGITTDALSTALTVLGPDGRKSLLRHYPDAEAYVRKAR
jgi:thiamine biosynthesis lipoprotein